MARKKTTISNAARNMDALIKHLKDDYASRQFQVQVLEIRDAAVVGKLFQVMEASKQTWLTSLKNLTGLGTAASLKLIVKGQDLEVEVFGGKWLDKVAAGAVSLVVLWPLVITSGVGAWRQNALLDALYEEVVVFLAGHNGQRAVPTTPSVCSRCARPITARMKFCGGCGYKLSPTEFPDQAAETPLSHQTA